MERIIAHATLIEERLIFLLFSFNVFAKSGCCSHHGGVDCAAGSQANGHVICVDGNRNSSCLYSEMVKCGGSSNSTTTTTTTPIIVPSPSPVAIPSPSPSLPPSPSPLPSSTPDPVEPSPSPEANSTPIPTPSPTFYPSPEPSPTPSQIPSPTSSPAPESTPEVLGVSDEVSDKSNSGEGDSSINGLLAIGSLVGTGYWWYRKYKKQQITC